MLLGQILRSEQVELAEDMGITLEQELARVQLQHKPQKGSGFHTVKPSTALISNHK